jgi:hypothetical protein
MKTSVTRIYQVITLILSLIGVEQTLANPQDIGTVEERLKALESNSSSLFSVDNFEFAALIEIEGSYTDTEDLFAATENNNAASDLVVATVELGVDVEINDAVSASVVTLYEEDETDPMNIDVAVIEFDLGAGLSLKLGQDYIHFGAYETQLVNDTLVLELAEDPESIAVISYEWSLLTASAFVFNGDIDDNNNDLENYGLSVFIANETFTAGVDYQSNVADTETLTDLAINASTDFEDLPDAFIVYAMVDFENVVLITEYFKASEFNAIDFDTVAGNAYEPEAIQLEVGINIGDWTLAAAFQATDGAAALLPEQRISVGGGTDIYENVTLTVEYWLDEDYDISEGGSGEDANNFVAQIAVTF